MIHGGKLFVSNDGGATWPFHLFALKGPEIEWLGTQTNYFLSTGQLAFDPHDQGKVWYAEGFGVWWTRELDPVDIPWTSASVGIEEVCGNDVIAPPGGKPVGAMWDVGAFYFSDVDQYNAKRSQPTFMSTWALDWCASDPKFLVGVFRSHLDFVPNFKSSGYSTDGGLTWTRFPAVEKKTLPADLDYGVIAISANSTDHIVWCPAGDKLPYFTADRGATWTKCNFGEGWHDAGNQSPYTSLKSLCADRVAKDTFYFYTPQEGLWKSTDGGATFAKTGNLALNGWNAILKATPGREGDLWYAANGGGGLHHSTDGGVTWSQVKGLNLANNLGFGKAKEGSDYLTLYVAGMTGGSTGIYRSTDQGATWDKIVDYPLGIYDAIDAMDGDKEVFGQVYVCFSSTGFAYGKLRK